MEIPIIKPQAHSQPHKRDRPRPHTKRCTCPHGQEKEVEAGSLLLEASLPTQASLKIRFYYLCHRVLFIRAIWISIYKSNSVYRSPGLGEPQNWVGYLPEIKRGKEILEFSNWDLDSLPGI